MRAFENDDYLPEYRLMVLADPEVQWGPDEDPVIPRYRDRGDMPAGSFAGSGAGWIVCQASDEAIHEVRLELHDAPVPDDRGDFDDVLETPYRAGSGGLTLTTLTGGYGQPDFQLSDDEWFRVRVARRRDSSGNHPVDNWVLRFWPCPDLQPPVWLARSGTVHPRRLPQDVEAVLRWTPYGPLQTTLAALAGRLLLDEAVVRAALSTAEQDGLLYVDESPDGLLVWPGSRPRPKPDRADDRPAPSRPEPPPRTSPRIDPSQIFTALLGSIVHGSRQDPPPAPAFGAPPRAGLVQTDGAVVVWHDGVRAELGRVPRAEWIRAWETTEGVLVAATTASAWLVSADGRTEIDDVRTSGLTLMGDGRRVALVDSHHHRRTSRYALRVVDPAGGAAQVMPWSEDQEIAVLGAYQDTVFFDHRATPGGPSTTMRWNPGSDPVPHERPVLHVDPVSGTTCTRTAGGFTVHRPDGTTMTVQATVAGASGLVPGGTGLWAMGSAAPAEFHLVPFDGPPRTWSLPNEPWESVRNTYETPIWEDNGHVLIGHTPQYRSPGSSAGLRIAARGNTIERLPPTDSAHRIATLIRPLLPPAHPGNAG